MNSLNNAEHLCPICGMPFDDQHFESVKCPYLPENICCNCDENLGLMFTNFVEKPSGKGYIEPDFSDRLAELTGRSYLQNRLLFYQACVEKWSEDSQKVVELTAEIESIRQSIAKGGR
jgi:hypothetical protein